MQQATNGAAAGGVPSHMLEEVLGRIEDAVGELAGLVGADALDGWDAPGTVQLVETHGRVRRLTGRLDGVRYTLLPRIEDAGSWRSGGMSRTFPSWLRLREGVSAATAHKDVTTARRLATALPQTRERLLAGRLGIDHARVMSEVAPTSDTRQDALAWLVDTRTGEPTTPEQFVQTVAVDFTDPADGSADDPDGTRARERVTQVLEDAVADGTLVTGEGLVLREAGVLNADQFRTVARRFATVTDPDTDDAEDDKTARGEYLDLAKTFGGYHVEGFLTDEHGLLLSTAVNAVMSAPSAEDGRTPGQRRAQALADVARVVLGTDAASPGAAVRPHLNVTVSWTELVTQVTRTRDRLCLTSRPRDAGPRAGLARPADGRGSGIHRDRRPGPSGAAAPARLRQCGHPGRLRAGRRRARRRPRAAHRDRSDAPRGDRPGQALRVPGLRPAGLALRGPPRGDPLGRRRWHVRGQQRPVVLASPSARRRQGHHHALDRQARGTRQYRSPPGVGLGLHRRARTPHPPARRRGARDRRRHQPVARPAGGRVSRGCAVRGWPIRGCAVQGHGTGPGMAGGPADSMVNHRARGAPGPACQNERVSYGRGAMTSEDGA